MSEEQKVVKPKYKKSTIIKEGQEHKKPTRQYLDNNKFYEALVERKKQVQEAAEEGIDPPKITDYIGKCFMLICDGLSRKHQFGNYPFREEMVGDAIAQCLKTVDSFDVDKGKNPFSYYTQTAYYVFLNRIEMEQENLYVKLKGMQSAVSDGTLAAVQEELKNEGAEHALDNVVVDNEYIEDFIRKFEARKARIRAKARESKPLTAVEKFMLEDPDMDKQDIIDTEEGLLVTTEEEKQDKPMLTEVTPEAEGETLNG